MSSLIVISKLIIMEGRPKTVDGKGKRGYKISIIRVKRNGKWGGGGAEKGRCPKI